MADGIVIAAVVLLAIVSIVAIIGLVMCVLKQHELIADINRQAQLLVAEAIEKERLAMEEYEQALKEREPSPQQQVAPYINEEEQEEAFNPHEYTPR